jgi:hypothetical protein
VSYGLFPFKNTNYFQVSIFQLFYQFKLQFLCIISC